MKKNVPQKKILTWLTSCIKELMMIEHEKQKYITDSEGNRIAVLSDIAVYEKIIGKPTTLNYTESCTDMTRSASDIFGMLKHRKPSHPVSADEMNEAIRKRRKDDCT